MPNEDHNPITPTAARAVPSFRFPLQIAGWVFVALAGALGGYAALLSLPASARLTTTFAAEPGVAPAGANELVVMVGLYGIVGVVLLASSGRGATVGRLKAPEFSTPTWYGGAVIGFVLALAGMSFMSMIQTRLGDAFVARAQQSTAGAFWGQMDLWERFLGGVGAAGVEESSFVVLPVATVFLLIVAFDRWRRRMQRPTITDRSVVWVVIVGVVLCALLRFDIHAYQGLMGAAGAAVWGTVNVLVFLRFRSVLALILAHVVFDTFVAGGNGLLPVAIEWTAMIATAVIGIIWAIRHRQRMRPQLLVSTTDSPGT